ncbi:MAG: CDP-glucose 4,6-dehydratase [Myxococcota bacterium]
MTGLAALRGRRVLVTGHTGFKGAWLTLLLDTLGAEAHGLALDPPSDPNLYGLARVGRHLAGDRRADVTDREAVHHAVRDVRPDLVLHLAAQSLVREGYARPAATFATNVMGTVHVLEAATAVDCPVVVVTSDKCYEPHPGSPAHREGDAMGGHDPYSASKGAAELVAAAWQRSFGLRCVRVRAGNVVGGGDWGKDRLVPDLARAAALGRPCVVRRPEAVRPWQFVLDPLVGYLLAGARLLRGEPLPPALNFGPDPAGEATVLDVCTRMARAWPAVRLDLAPSAEGPAELPVLRLDNTLARDTLGWTPTLDLDATVAFTSAWYRAWAEGDADLEGRTLAQIARFLDGRATSA